jgi:thiaminase/transcriptional activator TenA
MTTFCEQAWADTAALRRAIHALPFNAELAAGTLARERFRFYIRQDAIYLGQFARVLAVAAARAPDIPAFGQFVQFALGAVAVEQALHEHYLRQFGLDPAELDPATAAPDCFAYTSFLLATAYHEPFEVLIAALLPCFRLYWDVGLAISGAAAPGNPYRAWIDAYADQSFGVAVRSLMDVADAAAADASPVLQDRMLAVHRRATEYEYLFWDGAYHCRAWPQIAPTQA